ncbi:MAG: GTP 3',8-cyclase MoaA [Planctomycetes bacterium]|nr:GTP 3',8-cyclase MoaA [Planctomycetota bacterium]
MTTPTDRHGRPLRNLRLSVTDRCNLRCRYCMPEPDYVWLPKADVLSFEEIVRLLDVLIPLGVDRVRLTGGEPLLRAELPGLVRMIAARPAIRDLALTSNGVLLRDHARALRDAGLHRLTVSIDTLDPGTFRLLTGRDDHGRVLDGITAAREAGFDELKLDAVVIDGLNDGELPRLLDFARDIGAELRLIEYMDVGGATHWRLDRVVSRARMLQMLTQSHGEVTPLPRLDSAPADRFRLADGSTFGIISSVTQPFCATCDRARLTADGVFLTCLYATTGTDLRALLRGGADDDTLRQRLLGLWTARRDRGAEERAALPDRGASAVVAELRQDPHREMHTRGG